MPPQERPSDNIGIILKELSDIKANLAVNSAETTNIKSNISEIKNDIKEIKTDYVSRREFTDGLNEIRDKIQPLSKFIYAIISVILLSVIGAVLKLVLNQ